MNTAANPEQEALSDTPRQRVGKALLAGREKADLSPAQLADELRMPHEYISELESGNYQSIRSLMFARGYIRSCAQRLNLDTDGLLVQLEQPEVIVQIHSSVGKPRFPVKMKWQAAFVVLSLLIGLLVFTVIKSSEDQDSTIPTDESLSTQIDDEMAAIAMDDPGLLPFGQDEMETGDIQLAPIGDDLLLRFTGDCWVEVQDRAQRILIADNKMAGDEVLLSGEPPYRLVIGDVAMVEVFFGGKLVLLKGTENNSAKVTIGAES
ncbi:MAG: RodZ domain-containing protein [Pseudomonadales bacterium]